MRWYLESEMGEDEDSKDSSIEDGDDNQVCGGEGL